MTNSPPYTPAIFQAIAQQVATRVVEQYLFATPNGLSVMFPSPEINAAIDLAMDKIKNGVDVLRTEYFLTEMPNHDVLFKDGCVGTLLVDGVLVEFSVRELQDGIFRVLFSRVDALNLYSSVNSRLSKLEETVQNMRLQNLMIGS